MYEGPDSNVGVSADTLTALLAQGLHEATFVYVDPSEFGVMVHVTFDGAGPVRGCSTLLRPHEPLERFVSGVGGLIKTWRERASHTV